MNDIVGLSASILKWGLAALLCCPQTDLNLKLVAGAGIEPAFPRYERGVMPLHYPAINGRLSGLSSLGVYSLQYAVRALMDTLNAVCAIATNRGSQHAQPQLVGH